MTKQYDNRAVYRVTLNNHYLVTISFDHRTSLGKKVYEAHIINLDRFSGVYTAAHVYKFTDHCLSEADEARWIAGHHEHKYMTMRGEQA